MIEDPQSFVVRTELLKTAFDNGFRLDLGNHAGWLHLCSTTAQGDIALAAGSQDGPWFLAVGLPAVAAELALTAIPQLPPPPPFAAAVYSFGSIADLHHALDRVWRLGVSLPEGPLQEFLAQTAAAPRATEAERLGIERVGQNIFRQALLKYWNGACPLTGITDPALLRASHIVPWAECESDALRLDVYNGLLLSALWDAAFDSGLVSFADNGHPLFSPALSPAALHQLTATAVPSLRLTIAHQPNLARHRAKHGFR